MGTVWAKQYVEVEDARFPLQEITESGPLELQGAGLLKWGIWFDVYAAAYYEDTTNPANRKLVIQYFVPIEARQIKTAAEKHLRKQQGEAVFASIKPALDRLHAAMDDVDKGDSYAITLQQQDILLERNGELVLRLAEPDLGRLYLDLWLGKNPLDEDLRLSLLGNDRG
jgi:hypothetical protein